MLLQKDVNIVLGERREHLRQFCEAFLFGETEQISPAALYRLGIERRLLQKDYLGSKIGPHPLFRLGNQKTLL